MSKLVLTVLFVVCAVIVVVLAILFLPRLRTVAAGMNGGVLAVIMIVFVVLAALFGFLAFAPAGEDSLFKKSDEGFSSGDGEIDIEPEETGHGMRLEDALRGNADDDRIIHIYVRGKSIAVGLIPMEDIEELEDCMSGDELTKSRVVLTDEYAHAGTYKAVREVLDGLGYKYKEVQAE